MTERRRPAAAPMARLKVAETNLVWRAALEAVRDEIEERCVRKSPVNDVAVLPWTHKMFAEEAGFGPHRQIIEIQIRRCGCTNEIEHGICRGEFRLKQRRIEAFEQPLQQVAEGEKSNEVAAVRVQNWRRENTEARQRLQRFFQRRVVAKPHELARRLANGALLVANGDVAFQAPRGEHAAHVAHISCRRLQRHASG